MSDKQERALREALQRILDADFNCAPRQYFMAAQGIAEEALSTSAHTLAEGGEGAIPAGMKPWAGGDSAPEDWDGGPVLLADDQMVDDPFDWSRCGGECGCVESWCIIAYTPKPTPDRPAPSREGLREEIARVIDPAAWKQREHFLNIIAGNAKMPEKPENAAMYLRSATRRVDSVVAPSLAKADAILPLIPDDTDRMREALNAEASLPEYDKTYAGGVGPGLHPSLARFARWLDARAALATKES